MLVFRPGPIHDIGQVVVAVISVINISATGINQIGHVPIGVIFVLDQIAQSIVVAGNMVVSVVCPRSWLTRYPLHSSHCYSLHRNYKLSFRRYLFDWSNAPLPCSVIEISRSL